jgi:hypothetical protein
MDIFTKPKWYRAPPPPSPLPPPPPPPAYHEGFGGVLERRDPRDRTRRAARAAAVGSTRAGTAAAERGAKCRVQRGGEGEG